MVIKAIFTGVNSLGYIKKQEYLLNVGSDFLCISRIDGSGKCVYHSLKAFFSNWDNVKVVNN